MSRLKLLAAALTVVGASAFGATAAAQDGPTVTIEPSTVEAAGEHTFTISGSGYTVSELFVVPCEGATTVEELDSAGGDACDISNLTPAEASDGAFEVEVTYEVPEAGMCFAAGDLAQTEVGGACVSVGGDASATDDSADSSGDEQTEQQVTESTAMSAEAGGEDLADTGADTTQQLLLAGGLLLLGGAALAASRRFA